jgi:hypothetical protein
VKTLSVAFENPVFGTWFCLKSQIMLTLATDLLSLKHYLTTFHIKQCHPSAMLKSQPRTRIPSDVECSMEHSSGPPTSASPGSRRVDQGENSVFSSRVLLEELSRVSTIKTVVCSTLKISSLLTHVFFTRCYVQCSYMFRSKQVIIRLYILVSYCTVLYIGNYRCCRIKIIINKWESWKKQLN